MVPPELVVVHPIAYSPPTADLEPFAKAPMMRPVGADAVDAAVVSLAEPPGAYWALIT